MNQQSSIGFGTDANLIAGYAQAAGDRLGNFDLIYENTGNYAAYIKVMQYDGVTAPSGFAPIGNAVTVVPGGTKTVSFSLVNKRIGFFGSGVGGSTKVNISTVLRNKGDLRGADISIYPGGRKGWGYDPAFNRPTLTKNWGTVDPTTGIITPGEGPWVY